MRFSDKSAKDLDKQEYVDFNAKYPFALNYHGHVTIYAEYSDGKDGQKVNDVIKFPDNSNGDAILNSSTINDGNSLDISNKLYKINSSDDSSYVIIDTDNSSASILVE